MLVCLSRGIQFVGAAEEECGVFFVEGGVYSMDRITEVKKN